MSVAYAHSTLDPSVVESVWWANWSFDPMVIIGFFALFFYFKGIKVYRKRKNNRYPLWRITFFSLGVFSLILSLSSPLDYFADSLFFVHMIQHLWLMMFSAPMILLGLPFLPIVKGLPRILKKKVVVPIAGNWIGKIINFLVNPIVALALMTFNFWIWHYPVFYDLALNNLGWHLVEHAIFFWSSLFFWWNIIDPLPKKCKLILPLRLIFIVFAAMQNSALGAIISTYGNPLYSYYDKGLKYGFTQMDDQALGGAIMWVPGAMMYLFAFTAVFFTMAYKSMLEDRKYQLQLKNL